MPVESVRSPILRRHVYRWRCLQCGGVGISFETKVDAMRDLVEHWDRPECKERS